VGQRGQVHLSHKYIPPSAFIITMVNLNYCSDQNYIVKLYRGDDVPRYAREKSQSGIYHAIIRGINKQKIFFDVADRKYLLDLLLRYKQTCNIRVYGYCFMDNHIHLLVRETDETISNAIKRISGSYVFRFNKKYERCGHLFQERYRSEPVEDEAYFLTALRYIHQNPLKAGMVSDLSKYKWSSYNEYISAPAIVDCDFVLNMFSSNRSSALEQYIKFMNMKNNDCCLEYENQDGISDDIIMAELQGMNVSGIEEMINYDTKKRNAIIKHLKEIDGVTVRQLSNLTGISKSTIGRIK